VRTNNKKTTQRGRGDKIAKEEKKLRSAKLELPALKYMIRLY
jgi:hypothetical protein